jgi:hypothetical protein
MPPLVAFIHQVAGGFVFRLDALQRVHQVSDLHGFMAQHSLIHAEMIANYRSDAAIPQLQVTPLATLHDRLKTSLREEIAACDDIDDAADKLSRAEEIVSMAYTKIAAHYEEVAATYRMISNKFNALADDERQHHDYIRREHARINPTPADSTPGRDR